MKKFTIDEASLEIKRLEVCRGYRSTSQEAREDLATTLHANCEDELHASRVISEWLYDCHSIESSNHMPEPGDLRAIARNTRRERPEDKPNNWAPPPPPTAEDDAELAAIKAEIAEKLARGRATGWRVMPR